MSVAAAITPETKPSRVSLWAGGIKSAIYVLACLGVVFYGVPHLWKSGVTPWLEPNTNALINWTLMVVADIGAIVLLVLFGINLAGPNPPKGLREATFLAGVSIFVGFFLIVGYLSIFEQITTKGFEPGQVFGLLVLFGLSWLFWKFLKSDRLPRWSLGLETAGWLEAKFYKRNQGVRVRRLTILGLLLLFGSGIYTMIHNRVLSPHDWAVTVPFANVTITLLPAVHLTLPVILTGLSIWVAWRVVNFPVFADFLIATEAEINKVSWTPRARLIQDTVVVLITVLIITTFLFVVDWFWALLLSRSFIGVLPSADEIGTNQPKQVNTNEW